MIPNPHISVVMSVYNGARYLRKSVESILGQPGVEFEFITVNDGSTDESASILEEYARIDPRVRVIHQENAGLTRALIRGCAEARGELIARQDADDISLPGKLRAQADLLLRSSPDAVMASCWTQYIGPEDEILLECCPAADAETATRLMIDGIQGPPAHGTVMVRRDVYERVGGYRWEFYYGQDSDLWLRLLEHGRMTYVPEILYQARFAASSISCRSRQIQREFGRCGRLAQRYRQEGRSEAMVLKETAELHLRARTNSGSISLTDGNYFIGSCLKKRRDRRANEYLWRVVREKPFHVRAWWQLLFR